MGATRPALPLPDSVLLELAFGRQFANDPWIMDSRSWQEALDKADQHRLLPLIHARYERGELDLQLSEQHSERLRKAHRDSALLALAQRSELFAAVELLRSNGIESVALKGAWLAWYAYPAAAERPMRDIDILVPLDQALEAFDLLKANGYVQPDPSSQAPRDMVGKAKHFPPLRTPGGVDLELHMHAWEPQEAMEWAMPDLRDDAILANAVPGEAPDPCRYPCAQDMLAHLCIHAAYSHRFDVGPLLLRDVAYLLDAVEMDWEQFWRSASTGGWLNGAALVLALVDRWLVAGLMKTSRCPVLPTKTLIDDCEGLLAQNPAQRRDAGLLAAIAPVKAISFRNIGRRMSGNQRARFAGDEKHAEGAFGWMTRRLKQTMAALFSQETRRTAARMQRIGDFLSG